MFGIDIRNRERLEQYLSPAVQSSTFSDGNGSQQHRASLMSAKFLHPQASDRHASRSRDLEVNSLQRLVPVKRDPSQALEDDLYSATPPQRSMKRKHDIAILEKDGASQVHQRDESLSDIKKRLLRRGDWVGVTIQKPLELVYSSVKDGNDIGRRRKVKQGQRAKYRSAQSHIESPFQARSRPHAYNDPWMEHIERDQPVAPDVRISIGGRTVPPGVSSSTGKRRGPSTSGRGSSRAVSSEVLLLGSERSRGLFNNEHTRDRYETFGNPDSLLLESSRATPHRRRDKASQRSHSLLALSNYDDFLGSNEDQDQDKGWVGVTADSLAKLQHDFQGRGSPGGKSSNRSREHATPRVDLHRSLRPGQEVFSSSTAPMHHPRPRTSKRSVLLQEGSSQLAESNVAQLGKPKATVSSSQQLEDEIWRSWVAPESEDEVDDNQIFEGILGNGWLSPGPSMAPPERSPTRSNPGEDVYSSELEAPDDPDQFQDMELDDGSERSNHEDASSSQEKANGEGEDEEYTIESLDVVTSSQDIGVSTGDRTSSNVERGSADVEATQLPTDRGVEQAPDHALPAPHDTLQSEEDSDDIWRKFVFGSSVKGGSPDLSAAGCTNGSGKDLNHSPIIAYPSLGQIVGNGFHSQSTAQPTTSQLSNFTGNSRVPSMTQSNPVSSSPACDGRTSMYASNGSVPSSSSKLAPTSRAVHASSPSSISQSEYSHSRDRQHQVVFTKPRPFIGRNSKMDAAGAEEPLYVGSRLRDHGEYITGPKRKRDKHMSRFAEPDEQDELESIEDDWESCNEDMA